jgi:Holliday junction DNA helicase RuvA
LSSLNEDALINAIIRKDAPLLQSVKGIGPKAAQRLILELHDKLGKIGGSTGTLPGMVSSAFDEALQAMQALGFVRAIAEKALMRVSKEQGESATTESLVKDAFKYL